MRLLDVSAAPHPDGNAIVVSWRLPEHAAFGRVRVVRREGTHPVTPNPASAGEGVVVPVEPGRSAALDTGLRGETVYYYSLYPYEEARPDGTVVVSDPAEQQDPRNRTSALATAPAGIADELYRLLPSIFGRFDTVRPPAHAAGMRREDELRGALRRFLDLPGAQLDRLYAFAEAMLQFHEIDRVDGELLPLLAEWIGWRTDRTLELAAQRTEVRHATALYQAIGLIPVVGATVQRVGGRRSRVKEFVHNVALTTRPERLNLWQLTRRGGGWDGPALVSLDGAYAGRAAVARAGSRPLRMFHEHEQDGRSAIWSKELQDDGWGASEPVTDGLESHKHPSAASRSDDLVLFWSAYDGERRHWTIQSRTLRGAAWSAVETFVPPGGDARADRRRPVAVSDGGGIWLFWLERDRGRWSLRYNRHDGRRWQLRSSPVVANPPGGPAAVVDDAFALVHPADEEQRLWLFWAREDPSPPAQDPTRPRQTRWNVAYRVKAGLDPEVADDWSEVRTLPKAAGEDEHDREPYALVQPDGDLEVFWSARRGDGWSVWRRALAHETHAWSAPELLPSSAGTSMRAPVAFRREETTVVVVRSSRGVRHRSAVFSGTETVDGRYAGTRTLHVRDAGLLALRGGFEDVGTYLYDTGRAPDDWYARDTVGVYVGADTDEAEIARLGQMLEEFVPATDRAVLIRDAEGGDR